MTIRIGYSSAPSGAGKTYRLVRRIQSECGQGCRVLLLQPTIPLIEQTAVQFRSLAQPLAVRVFHGKAVGQNVVSQLAKYLSDPEDRPQVVLATHQVLARIPYLPRAKDWELRIDECPQVDKEMTHLIPKTHRFLTDLLNIEQSDGVYGRVLAGNANKLRELARNLGDDELLDQIRETASVISNPHWDCFVNLEHYHKLLSGKIDQLTIYAVLKPTVIRKFGSVFITGANLTDSGVYHLWSWRGVSFERDDPFTKNLRFQQHTNGNLATIYYATDRNWSRYLIDSQDVGALEEVRRAALTVIGQRPFIWQANKSVQDSFFSGERIPNIPYGLNAYSDVHDCVFLSALNPSPGHCRFLEAQGLSYDEIERQGYFATAYQAVLRTSLRDVNNCEAKNLVVPDLRLAEYLSQLLPGAKVQKLQTNIPETGKRLGRRKKHADFGRETQKPSTGAKDAQG